MTRNLEILSYTKTRTITVKIYILKRIYAIPTVPKLLQSKQQDGHYKSFQAERIVTTTNMIKKSLKKQCVD